MRCAIASGVAMMQPNSQGDDMRQVTTTVYKFSELSESAQDKALDQLGDINVNHDWYQYTYDDANAIGLRIDSFDTGRSNSIEGALTMDAYEVMALIQKEHGESAPTYKLAQEFLLRNKAEDGSDEKEALEKEFEYALLEEYLSMLRGEVEYLQSREAIIESLEANDYEFTKEGSLV